MLTQSKQKNMDIKKDTKQIMDKVVHGFSVMLLLAFVATTSIYAQRTVTVQQGVGTLNEAISSDTTAAGERVDSSTVYVLSSGGTYLLDGSIEHRDFHLSIVAEDGATEKPKLIPAVDNGGSSSRAFRARGSLTLKGLYVTNEDELEGVNDRIIRVSSDDITIRIDDTHLDKSSQSAFRIDGENVNLFLTNSTVSNIGFTSSPDNGRGVDDRGNDIDTLWFENNTFYNLTSQVLRDDGGIIKYAYINQNTMINIGKNGAVEFGPTVKAQFTNNIVYNGSFYGYDNDDDALAVVSLDSLSDDDIAEFGAQSFTLNNNNFYTSPDVISAYPDTVNQAVVFNSTVQAYVTEQGSADTNLDEAVVFTKGTAQPANVVTAFWALSEDPPAFPTDGEPFDFGYADTFNSYTSGTSGQQLGSLTWFGVLVSNEDEEFLAETPRGFSINGNYPNPFNPSTNISINLPAAADVSVEVFNMIGQSVLSIPAQRLGAGTNQSLRIDAQNLTSGMYIYRITARAGSDIMTNTGRMTLIK